MIRRCTEADIPAIDAIINEAAQAYRGAIPADCWHEPYMPREALRAEIAAGVAFSGWEEAGALVGVMGLQPVRDVTLIRHAYVRDAQQGRGIGAALLAALTRETNGTLLVGRGPTRGGRSGSTSATVSASRRPQRRPACCRPTGMSRRVSARCRWCWCTSRAPEIGIRDLGFGICALGIRASRFGDPAASLADKQPQSPRRP